MANPGVTGVYLGCTTLLGCISGVSLGYTPHLGCISMSTVVNLSQRSVDGVYQGCIWGVNPALDVFHHVPGVYTPPGVYSRGVFRVYTPPGVHFRGVPGVYTPLGVYFGV